MNPEIKEAHSNIFKQREKFEAKIIAPAEALEKLSDEALEGVAGGGYYYKPDISGDCHTFN